MSRNSKNARLNKQAKDISTARKGRAKAEGGEKRKQGRATAPKHGKTHAWWQRGISYSQFIKGGAKAGKRRDAADADEIGA